MRSMQFKGTWSAFLTLFLALCAVGTESSAAAGFQPLHFCPTLLAKYRPIPGEQADRLAMESQNVGEARRTEIFERFVVGYSRLAQKIAWHVQRKNPTLDFADLYQEATLSIGDAMRTFDVSKGHFFGHVQTRMMAAVRRAVLRHYADLGVSLFNKFGIRYFFNRGKVVRSLEEAGVELTAENLTREWNRQFPHWEVTLEELKTVEESFALKWRVDSLEQPASRAGSGEDSEDDRTHRDLVSDPDQELTDQLVAQHIQDQAVRQAVADFSQKLKGYEKQIFEQRVLPLFSDSGDDVLSLNELGKFRGVSRESARQNQNRLVQKFKRFLEARGLSL